MYQIDKPNLIESDKDHFNLYPKVEGITNFLENIHQNEVIKHNNLVAIYGEWGSGKSSVVKTVKNKLNEDKFNSFIFEAWKYEKDDNLPFSIFEAIMDNIIGDKDAVIKILKEGFWEGLKSFANGITIKGKVVNFSLKDVVYPKIKESLYTKIENFIEEFKKILEKYSEGKTTVVFIDDLDRCEDESIINLLVALKLMFALDNVIFVCCIDKLAIIEAVKRKYNNNQEKAENFLDKLFLFDFNIIPIEENIFLSTSNILEPIILSNVFKEFNIKTPRKKKKIVNKIIMLQEFLETSSFTLDSKEKEFYFVILYYLLAQKEVNFIFFNNFLNLNYKSFYLKKESIQRIPGVIQNRYFHSTLIKLKFNTENENKDLNTIMNKMIDFFNNLFVGGDENKDENILNGNIFRQVIKVLKEYS